MSTGFQQRIKERLPARPESVAPLRRAVVAYAGSSGASDRQCEDIALAVSEALSNAVVHAYVGHDRPGEVAIEACVGDGVLHVEVCDAGGGMLPRTDSPGLGLGLALMGRITERLELESHDAMPGVCVRMTFAIG
ncbi:MAG: ATP-binding protein [Solirubrobacteraceae bacterium]